MEIPADIDGQPFLKQNQIDTLLNHLCDEFEPEYAHYFIQLVDGHCADYYPLLKSRSESFADHSKLIESLKMVIESLHWFSTMGMKKPDGLQLLDYLAAIERNHRLGLSQKRSKGAPKKTDRDDLIRAIYAYYPRDKAKKTEGSHFERTVEMVLGIVDSIPKDLHKTICNALKEFD
jgi:hypothetical protein